MCSANPIIPCRNPGQHKFDFCKLRIPQCLRVRFCILQGLSIANCKVDPAFTRSAPCKLQGRACKLQGWHLAYYKVDFANCKVETLQKILKTLSNDDSVQMIVFYKHKNTYLLTMSLSKTTRNCNIFLLNFSNRLITHT